MALRVYFGIVSLAILVLSLTNYWVEYTPNWKDWQRDYYHLLAETIMDKGGDSDKATDARNTAAKFVQIYNQELGVADRCVICHLGMDSPLMEDAPNPHKAHPGNLLASHPYQQVGCTICHDGQGRATTQQDAHGHVSHWERPLLVGDFVQATCTKCHQEDEVPDAPVLTRGRRLLRERGCLGCHQAGELVEEERVGPRLTAIGSKVSRKWLNKWLANPKDYLPHGRMPQYDLSPAAVDALAAYLMTFRDPAIDATPDQEGDYDAGATVYRESQCIVCHVTREDSEENPVGGIIGPDLRRIGNKVNQRWLVAYLKDPHAFLPNTKMPRFHFSDKEALDLAQFALEEWVDYDLQDAEEQEPEPPPDPKGRIQQGKLLFVELGCTGCHDLRGVEANPIGPDLTFIGSKPVHDLDFGDAKVRHSLRDFLYTKLKSPQAVHSDFRLPPGGDPASDIKTEAIWKNLGPAALFSESMPLPEGSDAERLAWILARAGEAGVLDAALKMPSGRPPIQAAWLIRNLNAAGALSPLKMPDFQLSNADAKALCVALMSQSEVRVSSKRYEVPRRQKVFFNPKDQFGRLERRYRCLSCHSIRGSGDRLACDLTLEGSRANRQWLYHFLNKSYSMRRTLSIAMPIFHFPDKEARFMADYMGDVFVDTRIGVDWLRGRERADPQRGKTLFDAKGCIACHQVHGKGGDIGPSLTTQVPEFPQGTWVGDKLRGEWIYQWLKNPQALVPDTLEPNLGLSDEEALDLTAYMLSLKNPEFDKDNSESSQ